jgi:adenine-specific DNA-methyltransferase
MEKRLTLAASLLKPTGAIFISIDDNEVAQLKLLCNSIFGVDNFVAQFIRKDKVCSGNDSSHVAIEFDYMFCYAKDKKKLRFNKEVVNVSDDTRHKFSDSHVARRGKYLLRDLELAQLVSASRHCCREGLPTYKSGSGSKYSKGFQVLKLETLFICKIIFN